MKRRAAIRRTSVRWSAAEELVLRSVYPRQGAAAVARCLPGRSVDSIRTRARQMGVKAPDKWSEAEQAVLREHYPSGGSAACAPLLPKRSRASILQHAVNLGLRASPECHARGRFRPGQSPWNKGKAFNSGGRSAETRFKPGNKPRNWRPIGHERICDGFLQRKVTDTGCTWRDYRPVHHLLWEQHHGPIPEGRVVVFRNGDRADIRLENLELISRAELLARNSIHRLPDALRRVISAKARLTRAIGELDREKQG